MLDTADSPEMGSFTVDILGAFGGPSGLAEKVVDMYANALEEGDPDAIQQGEDCIRINTLDPMWSCMRRALSAKGYAEAAEQLLPAEPVPWPEYTLCDAELVPERETAADSGVVAGKR